MDNLSARSRSCGSPEPYTVTEAPCPVLPPVPHCGSEDSLERVALPPTSSSQLSSRSLPWCSQAESLVVDVAAHYSVMGCSFVIEGQHGELRFAASAGPDLEEVAQDGRRKGERGLFRHHTLREAPILIGDLHDVEFFKENPLVQKSPNLRFYVATPVVSDDDEHVGVLAIYDDTPRPAQQHSKRYRFLRNKAREMTSLISHKFACEEESH